MRNLKSIGLIAIVFCGIILTGCRNNSTIKEEILGSSQIVTSEDGSMSIKIPDDWNDIEVGIPFTISIANKDGSKVMNINQFPKLVIEIWEDMEEFVQEMSYVGLGSRFNVGEEDSYTAPEVEFLNNVQARKFETVDESENLEGVVIFGETDYAYYSFLYGTTELSEEDDIYIDTLINTMVEGPVKK